MAAHRYWRIRLKASALNAYSFCEIQFRTTAGVALPFSGGTASAAQTWSTDVAANATDGNINTMYGSTDTSGDQWWAYDYGVGNALDIVQITITSRIDSNYQQTPTSFIPEWSDNGVSWTSGNPITATWSSLNQTQSFAVTFPAAGNGVMLLVHADGANGSTVFTDASPVAHTLTPTATTVSTVSPKFGTGSADFTAGITSRIDTGNGADFDLGSGAFTIEGWAYFTSTPLRTMQLVTQWISSGGMDNGWSLGTYWSGNHILAFFYSTNGNNYFPVQANYTPALNTWIHIAVDRDAANVVRLYADGVVLASATISDWIFNSPRNVLIGNDGMLNLNLPGRIDEVRIVRGQAMYGGAFAPPTGPFGGAAAATQARVMVMA